MPRKDNKNDDFIKKLIKKRIPKKQNYKRKNPFISFLLIVLLLTALYQIFGSNLNTNKAREKVAISEIQNMYSAGELSEITLKQGEVEALKNDGSKIYAHKLLNEKASDLGFNRSDIETKVEVADIESGMFWGELISALLPILLIVLVISFFMRKAGGSGGFGFSTSKAKLFNKQNAKAKFTDVAGCHEAKEELVEVVDFLKDSQKYSKMGAKIPRGILLVGAPGTGKTLLARAVAGEAGVPFFSISGSEFIEMFVGVGASRVRDLFEKAKKLSPAIIFIDEIDAIGKQRGPGFGGGHDEREQTLNQILTEMDGFENETNVIVIAATNRPDVLDKALLRPGRFDRRVIIDKPDIQAREEILKVHTKNKPLEKKIDFEQIAKKTSGFSGAELESVMNEAAIATAKRNSAKISQDDIFEAVEKVLMGPEKKSRKVVELEKKITAYHEVGHALVSKFLPECDPVHKISIVARGMAGGLTWFLPDEEKRMWSKNKFLSEIASLLGGRIAESVKFGPDEITTGASNDLERATSIARAMVTKYGMTSIGLSVHNEDVNTYTGSESSMNKNYSQETAVKIDKEVENILQNAYKRGEKILKENLEIFERISTDLLEKEVINAEEFEAYFKK